MTTDTVGGVWTYTVDLVRELSRFGVATLIVSMGRLPTGKQAEKIAAIPSARLVPTDYKLEWMQGPWRDVEASGELLLALEREFAPDVVHLNGYAHASLDFAAPKLVAAHSCVFSWWRAVKRESAPAAEWSPYKDRVELGLRLADLIVAPSHAMLDQLAAEYVFETPTRVIYNGSATGQLQGAGSDKLSQVFCAGRIWDEGKNVAPLDAAARQIAAPVLIAGETAGSSGFAAGSEATGARYLGLLSPDEVQALMRRSSIYCLPALYEPFGLSVLEAARAGCALVLGDIPSLREIWGGGCARFVDPFDSDAISGAINELLTSDDVRRTLARNAQQRSREYTMDRMASAYHQTYRQLCSRTNTNAAPGSAVLA